MSLYWLLKCSYLFDSFPVAHCFVTVCLWKVLAYPALADLIVFFTGRLQQSVYMEDVNLSANTHQPAHWANWKQNPFTIITKAAPFETRGLQLLLWRWTSSVCSFTFFCLVVSKRVFTDKWHLEYKLQMTVCWWPNQSWADSWFAPPPLCEWVPQSTAR